MKEVLARAIEAGGSTLRDYAQTDGRSGAFQHAFRVYDRTGEPCRTCMVKDSCPVQVEGRRVVS